MARITGAPRHARLREQIAEPGRAGLR